MNLPPRFLNWIMSSDGQKLPCRIDGTVCDAHDPANHVDYHTAAATGRGVAYALSDDDGWFFLDLDKCRTDDGWTAEATAIWQSFAGAWGEVSQSGRGMHIMGRCDPSRLQDRKHKWDGWLEFYTGGRFIAFGPHGWQPIGGTETGKDWTDQLLRFVPERAHLGELPEGRDQTYTGPDDDDSLIQMMLRSTGGASAAFGDTVTIRDLWEANATALTKKWPAYDGKGGFDHSSADAALMSHLAFWTGRDMPRMDRLFRRSGLMRDKYDKRADYRRDTIQNAARLCKRVYDVPRREPVLPMPVAGIEDGKETGLADVYLTVQEMVKHFDGCVYVRDMHRVLTPDGSMLKSEQFNAWYGGHVFPMMPDGTKPTRKAFEALTENSVYRFPRAAHSVFYPDRPFGTIVDEGVNIYVPPRVVAAEGDVSPFLNVLRILLPHGNDLDILLSWGKWVAQNPGKKALWAPVLQGVEGNGKSMFGECIAYTIGQQYVHRPRAKEIGSTFNAWQANKMLILVEEVHMEGRRALLDDLKPAITNYLVPIRDMHATEVNRHCPTNWVFTTNYRDAVLKSKGDRRYCVMFTAQQSREDLERDFGGDPDGFWRDYWRWLRDGGGFAAVAHYLMTSPPDPRYSPENCVRAPKTTSTKQAEALSMGPIEATIIEAVESEKVGFRGGWVSSWHLQRLMHERRYNIGGPRLSDIMSSLGYEQDGRASRRILSEDGSRPNLWRLKGQVGTLDDYLSAQGPAYT